ncbi:ATP-dependent DNA ligase [Haliscomenobacter sp.]|uniref:ATP-dependent DNA ligase n=1 Tax=Haliscomenobacter sp. TaxID=2717303 RepID=UPI003593DD4C
MQNFVQLFQRLEQSTQTDDKVEALADYFQKAAAKDKLWAIALLLAQHRPKRSVNIAQLREWAQEYTNIPDWLFEASFQVVGDLTETISLILPNPPRPVQESLSYWIDYIRELANLEEAQRREQVQAAWAQLDPDERFVFNKLITGGFRMSIAQMILVKALAKATSQEESVLAHRLMSNWTPDSITFEALVLAGQTVADPSKPYPFFLAYTLDEASESLGDAAEWLAERLWDGIRGQIVVRGAEVFVWSRAEELLSDKFPEFQIFKTALPNGTVIDGEILPFKDGQVLPLQVVETRISRKNLNKSVLQQAPVVFRAYDLLEWQGEDWRERPLIERRTQLEALVQESPGGGVLQISTTIPFESLSTLDAERARSREFNSTGLMLKRKNSPYGTGRQRDDWWKWKVDPHTIDAVLIYAQSGNAENANLYTDFTFAVWDGEQLVPFTKTYAGLSDAEYHEINTWVRENTLERFGPVRSVKPELVFELAFEGIQFSKRHKSGIVLRFPRIVRWHKDKPAAVADQLAKLKQLMC